MFKSKEKRDAALLIFMAAITAVFLIYIFLPSGDSKQKEKETETDTALLEEINKKKPPKIVTPPPEKDKNKLEEKKKALGILNRQLELVLDTFYWTVTKSGTPFDALQVKPLKGVLEKFDCDFLPKLLKLGFFDLKSVVEMPFPPEYDNRLKFNILVALFLVKIEEEEIPGKFDRLPRKEIERLADLDCYNLLEMEIQENYQLLPVLFYFTQLVKRVYLYPVDGELQDFNKKLQKIRDLTPARLVGRIRELLHFSYASEPYKLQWVENDSLNADDKKTYGNIKFKTYRFMYQVYLVFPDTQSPQANTWLEDLCNADSGNIELIDFSLTSEDPSCPLQVNKIYYTHRNSRFVVLLKEYDISKEAGYLDALVLGRLDTFHRSLSKVDFTHREDPKFKKRFNTQLDQLGDFLKKIHRTFPVPDE